MMDMRLDHVTLRTAELDTTIAFFRTVFGLEEGPRPQTIASIPGAWLYSEGFPIVHVIASRGVASDRATEAIDHVGLRISGYRAFRTKLQDLGIAFSTMDLPELDERRLFLRAPGGQLLEAVFSASESETK